MTRWSIRIKSIHEFDTIMGINIEPNENCIGPYDILVFVVTSKKFPILIGYTLSG